MPTREYQGEHRRYLPDPGHDLRDRPLDKSFHISRLLIYGLWGVVNGSLR
jgi:hypothetical protein